MLGKDVLLPWDIAHNKEPFKNGSFIWGINELSWNRILKSNVIEVKNSIFNSRLTGPTPCYYVRTYTASDWYIPKQCVRRNLSIDKLLMMQRRADSH